MIPVNPPGRDSAILSNQIYKVIFLKILGVVFNSNLDLQLKIFFFFF